jgi:hypothetical protein
MERDPDVMRHPPHGGQPVNFPPDPERSERNGRRRKKRNARRTRSVAIYELDEGGFFTEVCGQKVIKEACLDIDFTSWDKGHPLAVMFHYQAGCGDSLAGLYRGQGYVEAHASVSQKAEIRQYLPLKHAGWHAFEASKRYMAWKTP